MVPNYGEQADYRPLPGREGRFEWLEDTVVVGGVETAEGYTQRGDAVIEFDSDGTATDTSVYLDDDTGRTLVLHVLPLADGVRIHEEAS